MNVALVVHSQTGHTEYATHKVQEVLLKKGQKTDYIKLRVVGNDKDGSKDIHFKEMPDLSAYDLIIFGSHVEAFNLSKVMKNYLAKIDSLEGKKAVCLLTQGLPKKWMGAKNALKQMAILLKTKGAEVIATESVSWSSSQKREELLKKVTNKICDLI